MIRPALIISLLVLSLVAQGCSGGGPARSSGETNAVKIEGPAQQLVGAWISTEVQQRFGTPCPWIFELFTDGSVETNFLSDDRGAVCAIHRVRYDIVTEHQPPLLRIGGQLSRCLFERRDDRLRLSCEDHGVPSPDTEDWIAFEPLPIEPMTSLSGMVGTWLAGGIMGGPTLLKIDAQGVMSIEERGNHTILARIELVGDDRALFKGQAGEEKCLFRATRHRLSLRCYPATSDWPKAFFDATGERGGKETMVFYRLPSDFQP